MQQEIKVDYHRLRPTYRVPRFATLRTVGALILRELGTTNGRRPGGYLWKIIEPIGGIFAMTLLFSLFLKAPPLGTSFAFFYATGMIPFLIFMKINKALSAALSYSKQLLVYPRVTIIDALLARLILNALTQISISVLTLSTLLLVLDTGTRPIAGKIVLAHVLVIGLGTGWGILNCLLISVMPLWQSVWSILTRPLVLLSGVIFMYNMVPMPYRDWLWFNPLIHVVGLMRGGFYPNYDDSYVSVSYVVLVSLLPAVLGLVFLRRYYRDFRV